MAWVFVLAAIALASSVAGALAGPSDQLPVFATTGGIAALVVASAIYRHVRPLDVQPAEAGEASIPLSRYPKLEAGLAAGLAVSIALFVLMPGPRRGGWFVIGAVCAWQLVRLEIDRRRVLAQMGGAPAREARRPGVSAAAALWAVLLLWGALLLAITIVAVSAGRVDVAAVGFVLCLLIFGGFARRLWRTLRA